MDKNFCQQIDKEMLVEQYVCGQLKGDLLEKFENHLRECEVHAQAITLEKAIKRGVSEFARGEIKTKLHDRLKKREDTRFLLLRYAAILFVAVITPLILYYQFNISPTRTVYAPSKIQSQKPVPATIPIEENFPLKTPGQVETTIKGKKESLPPKVIASKKVAGRSSGENVGHESSGLGAQTAEPLPLPEASPPQPALKQEMEVKIEDVSSQKIAVDYPDQKEIRSAKGFSSVYSAKNQVKKKDIQPVLTLELDKKVEIEYKTIKLCIKTFLKEDERSGYQIRLNIQILLSGEVGKIEVLEASIRSLDLEQCILNIIKKWIFSPGDEDTTIEKTIRYKQH